MKMVFTTGEVAKICKVSRRTVAKWFDAGRLQGNRRSDPENLQNRYISRDSLIKFMDDYGVCPAGQADERLAAFDDAT